MSRFTLNMAVCLGLLASVPAFAQKITGDISGTVTDPSGAAVRAATVRAENTATGEKASATTSDTGFYRLVNLSRPVQTGRGSSGIQDVGAPRRCKHRADHASGFHITGRGGRMKLLKSKVSLPW